MNAIHYCIFTVVQIALNSEDTLDNTLQMKQTRIYKMQEYTKCKYSKYAYHLADDRA